VQSDCGGGGGGGGGGGSGHTEGEPGRFAALNGSAQ